MIPLAVAIFTASLLGSFHCAGMCGAFVAIASGGADNGWHRKALLQGAYHMGRLLTYIALGAAAGMVGGLVNLAGALAGIQPAAAILAGLTMVIFGVLTFLRTRGVHISRMKLPAAWLRLMQAGHRAAMDRPPLVRSALIGLLTTLLPCGWLYAFVATAAGTGHALPGAALMAVFWAGTLPMLVLVGTGVKAILGPVGARLPALTAMLLIAAGLYTVIGRMQMNPAALVQRVHAFALHDAAPHSKPACCQKGRGEHP